jgi:hypothetical protein
MFRGACGDSLIVKYDAAVHGVMDGRFYVLPFGVLDKDDLRALSCYYENSFSSQVEMIARINQL